MNTKNSPILMLCIGLAAGMVIGYSFHDGKQDEESLQRSQIEVALKSLPAAEQKTFSLRLHEADSQRYQPGPPSKQESLMIEGRSFPVLPGSSTVTPKDLIDLRYEPPQLQLQ